MTDHPAAKPSLICLLGPTASGKTELAIALARSLDCELISVDSALVYRGLDIGSAKPEFPHHLIDICDPAEVYSAARFAADASRLAAEITARGRTPLLVGGSMLYFRAFLHGLSAMPAGDPVLRVEIEREAASRGWPAIHARLAEVDPVAAGRIHPHHSQRLTRALEVFRSSGVPISEWQRRQGTGLLPAAQYRITQLAVCPAERAVLHERISRRFRQMLAAGFVDEVRGLWSRGDLNPDLPALRAVGYRQLWQHIEGRCSLEEATDKGIAATRQLAKRQLTWLRKWPDLRWLCTDEQGNVQIDRSDIASGAGPAVGYGADHGQTRQSAVKAALRYLAADPM
jgi:tRNA dimethylallyltransferase